VNGIDIEMTKRSYMKMMKKNTRMKMKEMNEKGIKLENSKKSL